MRGVCNPALGQACPVLAPRGWWRGGRGRGTHHSVLSACRLLLRAVSCPSGCVRSATACGAAAQQHDCNSNEVMCAVVCCRGREGTAAHQLLWRGPHGCQVVDGVLQAAVVASATAMLLPALPLLFRGLSSATQQAGVQSAREASKEPGESATDSLLAVWVVCSRPTLAAPAATNCCCCPASSCQGTVAGCRASCRSFSSCLTCGVAVGGVLRVLVVAALWWLFEL